MRGPGKVAICVLTMAGAAWFATAHLAGPDGRPPAAAGVTSSVDDASLASGSQGVAGPDVATRSPTAAGTLPAALEPAPPAGSLDVFEAFMAAPDAHPEAWLVADGKVVYDRLHEFTSGEQFHRLLEAFEERADAQSQQNAARVLQMLHAESGRVGGAVASHVACGRRICVASLRSYDRDSLQNFNLSGIGSRPEQMQMQVGSALWWPGEDAEGILEQRVVFVLGYGLHLRPIDLPEQPEG
jgi:hypothetical protein